MKKITAVLIAAIMILTSFVCVAAETMAKPEAVYNYETEALTISGIAGAEEVVTLYVVNPSHAKEEIGTESGALQNFRKITADKDGKYSYSLKLANAEEGTYTIYVKADGKTANSTSVSYADATTLETIASSFLGEDDATVIKGLLASNADALQISNFAPYAETDKEKLSIILANELADKAVSEDINADISDLIATVRAASVVQLYNDGKKELVTSGTALLYDADLGLTALNENSLSIYSAFTDLTSASAKAEIINSVLNKNFATVDTFVKAFAEKVILKSVANPKELGYGHIAKILTAENCAFVGMQYYSLNNAQAIKVAALAEQTSLTALQASIKAIKDDPANSQITAGGGGGGGGGAVVIPNNSYIGNGSGSIPTPEAPKGSSYFADLGDYEWADEAVGYLYKKKIVSGTSESTFAPSSNLTREQFAKVLCILKGIEAKETEAFDDVDAGTWYAPYIGALNEAGLVSGIAEGTFGVGFNITREDLCVMVYRAFADKIKAESTKSFTDASSVSEYAKEAVNALAGAGILNGFADGSFRPQANCTRAEMAKIVYEIAQIIE